MIQGTLFLAHRNVSGVGFAEKGHRFSTPLRCCLEMGGVGGCSFGELEARVNNVELMWNQASNEQVLIQVLDHLERLLADVSQQDTFTDEEKQLREEMEEVVWTRYVLLLSQLGRTAEASSMLSQRGYSHMLSTEIFQNRATSFSRSSRVEQERSLDSSNPRCSEISHSSRASDRSQVNPDQDEIIQVYFRDDALPGTVWDQLLIAFGVESPFWREHNYEDPSTGYFSYLEPLGSNEKTTAITQAIRIIQRTAASRFPQILDVRLSRRQL